MKTMHERQQAIWAVLVVVGLLGAFMNQFPWIWIALGLLMVGAAVRGMMLSYRNRRP